MPREVDLGKLRKWLGKVEERAEASRNRAPERPAADRIVQLNLKVPAPLKRRMKHLAARDDVNLATLLARMVDHYENVHGTLPPIERSGDPLDP
jgi:hypothetical protein